MNDTERELRDLLQTKAGQAGPAPLADRSMLRRGRRRQVGTVLVAGVTALAVAGAAFAGLRTFGGEGATTPAGTPGNPGFTATIENLTLNVPAGWTLVDRWPIGAGMAVSSETTSFACVGEAVPAPSPGGGNAGTAGVAGSGGSDCKTTTTETGADLPIPFGGLPVLELSNADPGLGGTSCSTGSTLPSEAATLSIAIDYGATRIEHWMDSYPVWPQDLQPAGSAYADSPCGDGLYARFQAGGAPYLVWAGFGAGVSDADRSQVMDTFASLQVGDQELQAPAVEMPGYVIAGGLDQEGAWRLEAGPSDTGATLAVIRSDGDQASGGGAFGVPDDRAIELLTSGSVVFGAVTPEADRVELRPTEGDTTTAEILRLPDSLQAPFDAFVLSGAGSGTVVALGPDGELGRANLGMPSDPPGAGSDSDDAAKSDLRNALVVAKTYYIDGETYSGFDVQQAQEIESSLTFNTDDTASVGEVSIRDVTDQHILFATVTPDGNAFCIADDARVQETSYGTEDVARAADCSGGEAAWGLAVPTSSPAADPTPGEASTTLGSAFPVDALLIVRYRTTPSGRPCTQLSIRTDGGERSATCQIYDPEEPFVEVLWGVPGAGDVILGWVPPRSDALVEFVGDDGQRVSPDAYHTLGLNASDLFAIPLPTKNGEVHFRGVNGDLFPPVTVFSDRGTQVSGAP